MVRKLSIIVLFTITFTISLQAVAGCQSTVECSQQAVEAATQAIAVSKTLVPTGAVMAFNLIECPTGWKDYIPAYGRFIRGVDRGGQGTDPEGERNVGTVQLDQFQIHTHRVRDGIVQSYEFGHQNGGLYAPVFGKDAKVNNYPMTTGPTSGEFGSETRPKNVALLYCEKI